ncbi:MAG: hypothetical protein JXR91_13860 [Deltaproteobacteria bacterium]|nr:hypothetical protein [Deltaproteobacteria bacterium]
MCKKNIHINKPGFLLLFIFFFYGTDAHALENITVSIINETKIIELPLKMAKSNTDKQELDALVLSTEKEGKLYIFSTEEVRPVRAHTEGFMDVLLIGKNGIIKDILNSVPPNITPVSTRSYAALLKLAPKSCEQFGIKTGEQIFIPGINLSKRRTIKPDEDDRQKLEEVLTRSIKDNPDNPRYLTSLGKFYIADGTPEKATALLKGSTKKSVEMLVTLAVAYRNRGMLKESEQSLMEAIKIDPLFIDSYEQILLYNNTNQAALNSILQATRLLTDTLKQHRGFKAGRLLLFRLHISQNNLLSARQVLDSALVKSPEIIRAYGDLFLREGNFKKAAENYMQFITARPYHPAVKDLRIFIMLHYPKTEMSKK